MSPPLRVLFDSSVLLRGQRSATYRGGIYRYAQQLSTGLSQLPGVELELLCPDPMLAWLAKPGIQPSRSWLRLAKPLWHWINALPAARWARGQALDGVLRRGSVYHSPFGPVPEAVRRAGLPVVLTVHDLLPVLRPDWFVPDACEDFQRVLRSLGATDQVICVSQATRTDLLTLRPDLDPRQVHTIHLAPSPDLRPGQPDGLRSSLHLPEEAPIVLAVGTLEPRKNLERLVEAFERIEVCPQQHPPQLVIVGAQGWQVDSLHRRIAASPARPRIHQLGHLPDHHLASLYSAATVFVYPSLHEGFGLPPLEAMACGTPVICSNTSSIPEVVGEAAIQINPLSSEELHRALDQLLHNPEQQPRLSEAGLARASRFSWARTAAQTLQVYRLAVEATQS